MSLDKEATKQLIYIIKGLGLALVRLPLIEACYKDLYIYLN